MNPKNDQEKERHAEHRFLENVDRAIAEKWRCGHADIGRYGFAAVVANATPSANITFERSLRRRILVEAAREDGGKQAWKRIGLGRLVLAGSLAAAILIMALMIVLEFGGQKPGGQVAEGTLPSPSLSELVRQDVDALVERLNQAAADRTVVVFPAEYAELLTEEVLHTVVPLTVMGDATEETVKKELGALLPPSGLVDVVMVSQEAPDATGPVQMALETELFRLYHASGPVVESFGVLERSSFVAGPADVDLDSVGAVFEGGIELVAAGVLDDPQPGAPLRLAFDWRIAEPVTDSLVVFAHLIQNGDRLVAQRDTVPGNGLFPVESWEPGELVRDQFALLLPAELPAGEYEIQVGVYSAISGQRYRLIEPGNGFYFVVFRFTIPDQQQTL